MYITDMYSFDESAEAAQETYSAVCHAYERILQKLRLPVIKGKLASNNSFLWKVFSICRLLLSTLSLFLVLF